VVRLNGIGLKMTTLERVGVAPSVAKIVETMIRWFRHVERRPVDYVLRRVDQIEGSQITRGRGRPRKTIRETIKKDLEINETISSLQYLSLLYLCRPVGKLVGRYYDSRGNPTKYLKGVEAKAARGAQLLEKQKIEEAKQPQCSSKWSQDEGGEV
jgi:hypothetical protein